MIGIVGRRERSRDMANVDFERLLEESLLSDSNVDMENVRALERLVESSSDDEDADMEDMDEDHVLSADNEYVSDCSVSIV